MELPAVEATSGGLFGVGDSVETAVFFLHSGNQTKFAPAGSSNVT